MPKSLKMVEENWKHFNALIQGVILHTLQPIIYTDQTGKFPIQSSQRYKYVMMCYAYNCNGILAHHIKNRSVNELLQAYQHFCTILHNAGLSPHMHKMDNKHQLISNTSLPPKMQLSNIFLQIITALMQQSEQSKLGIIISYQDLPAFPKISPLHTGASSSTKPTSLLT